MTDPKLNSKDQVVVDKYLRLVAMGFENSISFWKSNLPDPKTRPASRGLVDAYISRMELQLSAIRDGVQAMLDQFQIHPTLNAEGREIGLWVTSLEPPTLRPKITEDHEDVIGEFLVRDMEFSYPHARELLRGLKVSPKGAPSKRSHTIKMMDARIVNGLSYAKLANKMCDCELMTHNYLCRERIRKRIRELETVLSKYGIQSRKKRRK
jgi:hypothetical protein